jgi:glutamate-1-semialdehyde aminotransferase
MHMLRERLQILVSTEQRRRLEAEAKRRGTSVASLIREAVDVQYGAVTSDDRLQALREIGEMRGRFLAPDELDRLAEAERDDQLDQILGRQAR